MNAWMVEQGMLDIADGDPIALVVETALHLFRAARLPGRRGGRTCGRPSSGASSIRYRIGIFAGGRRQRRSGRRIRPRCMWTATTGGRCEIPADWRKKLEAIGLAADPRLRGVGYSSDSRAISSPAGMHLVDRADALP